MKFSIQIRKNMFKGFLEEKFKEVNRFANGINVVIACEIEDGILKFKHFSSYQARSTMPYYVKAVNSGHDSYEYLKTKEGQAFPTFSKENLLGNSFRVNDKIADLVCSFNVVKGLYNSESGAQKRSLENAREKICCKILEDIKRQAMTFVSEKIIENIENVLSAYMDDCKAYVAKTMDAKQNAIKETLEKERSLKNACIEVLTENGFDLSIVQSMDINVLRKQAEHILVAKYEEENDLCDGGDNDEGRFYEVAEVFFNGERFECFTSKEYY